MTALITNTPKYQQVRNNIVARVGGGEWAIGSTLPPEADLAKEFGVSPGTVRKALHQLVTEMIVERRQGKGTFVMSLRPAKVCPHCHQPINGKGK